MPGVRHRVEVVHKAALAAQQRLVLDAGSTGCPTQVSRSRVTRHAALRTRGSGDQAALPAGVLASERSPSRTGCVRASHGRLGHAEVIGELPESQQPRAANARGPSVSAYRDSNLGGSHVWRERSPHGEMQRPLPRRPQRARTPRGDRIAQGSRAVGGITMSRSTPARRSAAGSIAGSSAAVVAGPERRSCERHQRRTGKGRSTVPARAAVRYRARREDRRDRRARSSPLLRLRKRRGSTRRQALRSAPPVGADLALARRAPCRWQPRRSIDTAARKPRSASVRQQ